MELLLNFLWLMLALPALLIWRRESASALHPGRSRSFVLLGCLLALLFPVVSATDDLHALRPEIEESSPSKRAVKQVAASKSPAWGNDGGLPARLVPRLSSRPEDQACGAVSEFFSVLPKQARSSLLGCRAPPAY